MLVVLNSSRINYSQTQNAGEDLRFTDADGTTELSYEIEEWDEAGTSYVWVKVPQIDASSSADYIWMYYGNATALDGQDPAAVWSNGFQAVWHLHNDFCDSTSNNVDGTNSGTTDVAGQIGDAQNFDPGVNGHISFNDPNNDLDLVTSTTVMTAELWLKRDNASGPEFLLQKGTPNGWIISISGTTNEIEFEAEGSFAYKFTDTVADTNWHHVAIKYDSSFDGTLYIDGVLKQTVANATAGGSSSADFYIGSQEGGGPFFGWES